MLMNNIILISIVCYRNSQEVLEFIYSLKRQKNSKNLHVVITCVFVDDYDEIVSKINKTISYEIIKLKENLGYLNNCLYGVNNSKYQDTKWIMITNTDIQFIENDFFDKFLSTNLNDDVWSIGTKIINRNDDRQTNPLMIDKPNKKIMTIKKIVFCNHLLYLVYNLYYYIRNRFKSKNNKNNKTSYVYAVHGSSFLLNKECIKELSSISKNIFMYGEEELIAAFIYKHNKKTLYIDELHINHNSGTVTSNLSNNTKFEYYKKSYKYLYDYLYNEEKYK